MHTSLCHPVCILCILLYVGLGRANAVKLRASKASLRRQQWDQGKENGLEDSQDTDDVRYYSFTETFICMADKVCNVLMHCFYVILHSEVMRFCDHLL